MIEYKRAGYMAQSTEHIKYILYCRKSTDEADRQVLSLMIKNEIWKYWREEGLRVVERFGGTEKGESHTAFKRGRPILIT